MPSVHGAIPASSDTTRSLRIAILDYAVTPTNAIGNCTRQLLQGLCRDHEFTVFAVDFENPAPELIRFIRIPAIRRPLFLLFLSFHLVAPLVFWWHRFRARTVFDLIQSIESNTLLGSLVYAHFCHRAYLTSHWPNVKPSGLRGVARWLDHQLHALLEPAALSMARKIVVPSRGLARELEQHYGGLVRSKISVLPNPIDLPRMQARPAGYNRDGFRESLGLKRDALVGVFVALGHFERKGLPLLLDAIHRVPDPRLRLLVVGGTPSALGPFRKLAQRLGVSERVGFLGMQADVRPFLWASDLFALPSCYEVFPLAALEAAAAGLPLFASPLNGVEEFVRNGLNGWLLPRNPEIWAAKLKWALSERKLLALMGSRAAQSACAYALPVYLAKWRDVYAAWNTPAGNTPAHSQGSVA